MNAAAGVWGSAMIRMPHGTIGWLAAITAVVAFGSPAMAADSPAGKEIAELVIQGNRIHSQEQIAAHIDSKPRTRFSNDTAMKDCENLLKTGWFGPGDIKVDTMIRPDGKVAVLFSVRELPCTVHEIVYRGAGHLDKEELEKLTNLKIGAPMNPSFNQQARTAILRHYTEKGRNWATVTLVEGNTLQDTRVVFDIAEGPSIKVSGVEVKYFGPKSDDVSTGRLKTQIASWTYPGMVIGDDYNPIQLEQDLTKVSDYYHGLGYLDVRVQRELIWSPDHRTVKIIFHVEEGVRYKVAKVQIDGNKVYDEYKLLGYTDLRNGDYYDKFVAKADQERLKMVYGFDGRNVFVRETVNGAGTDGLVNVHYQIEEREPVRVGDVKIVGNTHTRDNVIRRVVDVYPGQVLSYPDLLQAEKNLARLSIFEEDPQKGVKTTVEVENPENTEEMYKNILVTVHEKPTGSFMVGAGINSDAGLTGSIVLSERNFDITNVPTSFNDFIEGNAFRGAGQDFSIRAMPGTEYQNYSISWRDPAIFDSHYSLADSAYYFTRGYDEYDESRVGTQITLGRRFSNIWSANITERVAEVDITNVYAYEPTQITQYAGNSFLFGSRVSIVRDDRDSVLHPGSGSTFEAGAEWVTGTYSYPLLTAELDKYWTLYERKDGSGKQILSVRSQVSWAGDDTPVYERFYAGGFQSLRGFEFRGVGPFINGFNIGGNFAFLNSVEYQIPLMANDNLHFVTFVDSGTVEESVSIKDYRVAVGVGLRIAVPQLLGPVPLAFDFGVPLVKGPEDRTQVFSFSMGYSAQPGQH